MPTRKSPKTKVANSDRNAIQLKVTLRQIKPPIWRRLVVPDTFTLGDLHEAIQIAMGWDNYHLHAFRIGEQHYSRLSPDLDELEMDDEEDVLLGTVAKTPKRKFHYEYDFGDGWEHDIVVEKILPIDPQARYPLCLAGARACPPEDCGGVYGYQGILDALGDPENPEYTDLLDWLEEDYDPELFDVAAVNRRLAAKG